MRMNSSSSVCYSLRQGILGLSLSISKIRASSGFSAAVARDIHFDSFYMVDPVDLTKCIAKATAAGNEKEIFYA
jgi:hypothetical protein